MKKRIVVAALFAAVVGFCAIQQTKAGLADSVAKKFGSIKNRMKSIKNRFAANKNNPKALAQIEEERQQVEDVVEATECPTCEIEKQKIALQEELEATERNIEQAQIEQGIVQEPKIVGIVLNGLQDGQGLDVKVVANKQRFKTQTYEAGKSYDHRSIARSPYCGSKYFPMRTEGAFISPQFYQIESRTVILYLGKKNFTFPYTTVPSSRNSWTYVAKWLDHLNKMIFRVRLVDGMVKFEYKLGKNDWASLEIPPTKSNRFVLVVSNLKLGAASEAQVELIPKKEYYRR